MRTRIWKALVCTVLFALPVSWAQEADDAAAAAADPKVEARELMRQIRTREMQALRNSAELKQQVDELEKQRQELFKQADPELGPLYEQMEQLKTQRPGQGARGGEQGQGGGKGRPGQRRDKRQGRNRDRGEDAGE